MSVSFKYWEDCLDPEEMTAMWTDPEVSKEWIDAGENHEQQVRLSRDPDGQVFLTQTEMKAVVGIVVRRHFDSQIDQDMIRAIAELESDRQPLVTRYDKKEKDSTIGIMQILPKTAQFLASEQGYMAYDVKEDPELLYRPFINLYFGVAYLKWLSNFDGKERSEEFVVRAYRRGTKRATHKSTLDYWQRYLSVKQHLPSRREMFDKHSSLPNDSSPVAPPPPSGSPLTASVSQGEEWNYWDSRVSQQDMDDLWNHPDIAREWTKSGQSRGKVRFPCDEEKRPYLSRPQLRAVAAIVVTKHFSGRGIEASALCALGEINSMRHVNGLGSSPGIMGIEYTKALWLHKDLGYRAYNVKCVEDLCNPFVSVYFAAAYLDWLSQYEGRERSPQFIVQAFLGGPENVDFQETGPLWLKFEEALSHYGDLRRRRDRGSCSIM